MPDLQASGSGTYVRSRLAFSAAVLTSRCSDPLNPPRVFGTHRFQRRGITSSGMPTTRSNATTGASRPGYDRCVVYGVIPMVVVTDRSVSPFERARQIESSRGERSNIRLGWVCPV